MTIASFLMGKSGYDLGVQMATLVYEVYVTANLAQTTR